MGTAEPELAGGLPAAQRGEVAALLTAALAGLDLSGEVTEEEVGRFHRATSVLLATVVHAYGWPGIFETACACADISSDGVRPFGGNPLRYIGRLLPDGTPAPLSRSGQVWADFVTALIGADRTAARFIFDGMQPAQGRDDVPAPTMADFLVEAVCAAYRRQAGGEIQMQMQPGARWPPVCDFCCGPTAVAMFRCDGADLLAEGGPGTLGGLRLRIDDFEFWYACRPCARLIVRRPPDWPQVWQRHRANRPRMVDKESVLLIWTAFHVRRHPGRPEPLPSARPTPTPGRR